jgi:isopentenyl-diphosphate delta-isomerase
MIWQVARRCERKEGKTAMGQDVTRRKIEHVSVALSHDLTAPQAAAWADVRLVHQALPEVDLDEIDTSTEFLGHRLGGPIFISSLTGGHADVALINARLARAAERFGLAMGVGSQRAAIVDPALAPTYGVVRAEAPAAFLIANLGAPQFIPQPHKAAFTVAEARQAVAMIGANALALHLNYLQEAAQPEGDRRARGALAAIAQIVAAVGVPVIAKETGAGISRELAQKLRAAGVAAIDVGGAGGSSMAAMEAVRAADRGDTATQAIGEVFRDWGIPTPISLVEAGVAGVPLIATGGVRTGLDAARALALGATLVGVGFPMLQAASQGDDAVTDFITGFLRELRVAMHLTGAGDLGALRGVPVILGGATRAWLELRGFEDQVRGFARRA